MGHNYVIWGVGREGRAAARYIEGHLAPQSITFVDEVPQDDVGIVSAPDDMARAVLAADVLIKSPGVSLYNRLVQRAKDAGVRVTSLLNIWMENLENKPCIIGITGTKGKSTTSALLAHVLKALGRKVGLAGNIGVPVSEVRADIDYLVLELSSYQCADFDGACDIAAVTSLYPEHLNWHGSQARYYADKLRLLDKAKVKIAQTQVRDVQQNLPVDCVFCEAAQVGLVPNAYLRRVHNLANVGVVLAICAALGLEAHDVLRAMADFEALAHRQQEIGLKEGRLFVDDSIATTPQAAMAAMEVYGGRAITLIAGGQDRGIDYAPLVAYLRARADVRLVCLGEAGAHINALMDGVGYVAKNMDEAVRYAQEKTPQGGVVLLSPAAPSFGMFKDYVARGQAFASAAGF